MLNISKSARVPLAKLNSHESRYNKDDKRHQVYIGDTCGFRDILTYLQKL